MKKTISLLLTLLLLLGLAVPAAAAGPDLQKKGSVTIRLSYQRDPAASAEGAVFRLYRVGDVVDQDANLQFQLNNDFAGSNLSVRDLSTPGLAMQLVAYAKAEKLQGPEQATDADGKAKFTDLPMGLFLAEQVGTLEGYLPADPFLVSLPQYNRDRWEYDVLAEPKYIPGPVQKPEEISLQVKKIWADPGNHPAEIRVHLMQGTEIRDTAVLNERNQWQHRWAGLDKNQKWSVAEVVPEGYSPLYIQEGDRVLVVNSKLPELPPDPESITAEKRWEGEAHPDSVTVELWNGDTLYGSAVLSRENNWTHRWENLPDSDWWSVRENPIPKGYYPSYDARQDRVTVTNSKPEKPPEQPPGKKPPLIQTGQMNWPIPLLAASGMILIGTGLVLRRKRKED